MMSSIKLFSLSRKYATHYVNFLSSYILGKQCLCFVSSINSKAIVKNSIHTKNPVNKIGACEYSRILNMYGFSDSQINRILHPVNNITSVESHDIGENLANWHRFKVNNKHLLTVLSNVPELLILNPSYVNHRVGELMKLFTEKNIVKLLITCPKVFLDDFDTIFQKVEYIVNYMGVDQPSIVKSEALQCDIEHIKMRHRFVSYVGVFREYKKKERNRNPPINKVFSANINTLLKLSPVSKEEYVAFCDCYNDIILEEEEDMESSDDETDTDSD